MVAPVHEMMKQARELLEGNANLLAQARASTAGQEAIISILTQNGAERWAAEYAVQAVIAWFNMIDSDD